MMMMSLQWLKGILLQLEWKLRPKSVFYIGGSDVLPPPLEPAEEAKLLQAYAEGSQDARNILIERNLRLVAHIMNNG